MPRLFIISELFPPDETSTSYILGEMANASAREYEVHVICGPRVYDKRKKADVDHPFVLDAGVQVHRVKGLGLDKNKAFGKALSFLVMSWRLCKLARKFLGEGDKVLLVTNPAPLVLLMARLRARCAFEWNLLVHDVFPENTVPAGLRVPGCLYRWAKRRFDKAYARADRLIVLGRDMAQVVRKKAGEQARVSIVENWADVEGIVPVPFPVGRIQLEYAGNIGRVQGLEKLVEELPEEVELHFYGTGALENSLKAMGRANVFFHGPYFRSQQKEVLGACHAAIVTLDERMYGLGVPSKAYNILAAGRPILYFGPSDGEIGLLVKEHQIGYLGWPEKWDVEVLKEMGERARELAQSRYDKKIVLDRFLAVLR